MYRILVSLFDPFLLFFLLGAAVVVRICWTGIVTRRLRIWLASSALGLLVSSMPAVAYLGAGSLEWAFPPQGAAPEGVPNAVRGIVVLGGYLRPPDSLRTEAELGGDTLKRCWFALRQYRRGLPGPIIVCGGDMEPDKPGPTIAEAMRDYFVASGVAPDQVVIEGHSTTTFENAREAARLLRERGIERVVLITDGLHLKRATACFQKQGVEVVPLGSHFTATEFEPSVGAFLPDSDAASLEKEVLHEWLGIFWYRLSGRI